jgi:hypothetical protein
MEKSHADFSVLTLLYRDKENRETSRRINI